MRQNYNSAILGGGCFWCTEAVYNRVKGVISVMPGYAGGKVENPSYHEVCEGTTGHAEVIRIEFDPKIITYKKLLEIFFDIHDPTTLNRQGNDVGTQYRSIIFYSDDEQKKETVDYIRNLKDKKVFVREIITETQPLIKFYPAEDYHKDYYDKNEYAPYCDLIISPKIKHFEEKYASLLK